MEPICKYNHLFHAIYQHIECINTSNNGKKKPDAHQSAGGYFVKMQCRKTRYFGAIPLKH